MKRFICGVLAAAAVFSFAGCKNGGKDVNSTPLYASTQTMENCKHIEEYHKIPGELIRYVGGMAPVDERFTKIYGDTEGYNIINFLKVFDISKEDFTSIVDSYGMQLNQTEKYDVDIMYSGDEKKIDEYFTVK